MKKFNLLIISLLCLFCGTITAQTTEPTLEKVLDFINKDSLKRTVQDMQDFESRLCIQSVGQNIKVAQYLVDRLKNYGIENARIDSFYVSIPDHWLVGEVGQYMYNVIGSLRGTGNTDSTVIIGAHLDAISYTVYYPDYLLTETSPGADDNATGCAVMIEMARVIHENNLKPRHNIDFMAYDAEEIGLMGAYYDAQKRKAANENIIVMLNNDMVANQPESEVWKVSMRWYSNSWDVCEKAQQAFIDYTTLTPVLALVNNAGSDSYAYYVHNYKAFFTIEEYFSPYYHSESDLTEFLNFEYCSQVARMNFVLLADYAEIDFSTNNISESNKFEQSIEVFPNPARDVIRIHNYNDVTITQIDIYDISGRLLKTENEILQQQNILRLDNLSSGMFFMKIHTNNGAVNKKIIKQ